MVPFVDLHLKATLLLYSEDTCLSINLAILRSLGIRKLCRRTLFEGFVGRRSCGDYWTRRWWSAGKCSGDSAQDGVAIDWRRVRPRCPRLRCTALRLQLKCNGPTSSLLVYQRSSLDDTIQCRHKKTLLNCCHVVDIHITKREEKKTICSF